MARPIANPISLAINIPKNGNKPFNTQIRTKIRYLQTIATIIRILDVLPYVSKSSFMAYTNGKMKNESSDNVASINGNVLEANPVITDI